MSKPRASPWYRPTGFGDEWEGKVLVQLSPEYIALTLRDLEAYKTRALWVTDADYAVAYQALCKQGASLLMDIGDRLIREIRATRDGQDTPMAARDPQIDPFTLDLFTLRDIAGRLSTNEESAAFILGQIRDALKSEDDGETAFNVLRAIAAIVVGV